MSSCALFVIIAAKRLFSLISTPLVTLTQLPGAGHAAPPQKRDLTIGVWGLGRPITACARNLDLGQVHPDELYTKTQAGPVWVATALTVFSRLWLCGAIGWQPDEALITPVIQQVRAAAQSGQRSCSRSLALRHT